MRKQLMDGLRKAGQKLKAFDDAYAERVAQDIGSVDKYPMRHLLGASPIFENPQLQADTLAERLLGYGMIAGTTATNIGYRYGLPAAGVTLAGKGLYDMTAAFGNEADYPEEGQLPLS